MATQLSWQMKIKEILRHPSLLIQVFKPLYPTHTQLCSKKWQSRIPSLSAKHDSSVSYAQQQQWGPFRVWYISIKESIKKTRELMWVTAYLISCVLAHWEKRIGEITWQHHSRRRTAQEATQFHCKKAAAPAEPTRCPWTFIIGSRLGFLLNQAEMKISDFLKKTSLFNPHLSHKLWMFPILPFPFNSSSFQLFGKGTKLQPRDWQLPAVNFRQGEVYQVPPLKYLWQEPQGAGWMRLEKI